MPSTEAADGTQQKTCSHCGRSKGLDDFHRHAAGSFGRHSVCKVCKNAKARDLFAQNRASVLAKNRERRNAELERSRDAERTRYHTRRRSRGLVALGEELRCVRCGNGVIRTGPKQRYCEECREIVVKEQRAAWAARNRERVKHQTRARKAAKPEKYKAHGKKWRAANREKVNAAYHRRMRDPKRRLDKNMSAAIRQALRGAKSGQKWESLVGYTSLDLASHLERHFRPGMTWENYGAWHIDHRVPKSAFNYSDPAHIDFQRAWALDNLRPMWALENQTKNNRLSTPFQPSLQI